MKAGYKTTEFWLSAAAVLVGMLMSSGLLAQGTAAAQVAGLVASALAALGYTGARVLAKRDDAKKAVSLEEIKKS